MKTQTEIDADQLVVALEEMANEMAGVRAKLGEALARVQFTSPATAARFVEAGWALRLSSEHIENSAESLKHIASRI